MNKLRCVSYKYGVKHERNGVSSFEVPQIGVSFAIHDLDVKGFRKAGHVLCL